MSFYGVGANDDVSVCLSTYYSYTTKSLVLIFQLPRYSAYSSCTSQSPVLIFQLASYARAWNKSPSRLLFALRAHGANRTLACVSRPGPARSPQRVARPADKSHSRLHFAHSTRAISAEGCIFG